MRASFINIETKIQTNTWLVKDLFDDTLRKKLEESTLVFNNEAGVLSVRLFQLEVYCSI